ncbi:MAG: amino acid permease [Pyrinomonadaceae bacterium]|nr:amino acid permease [Phycisphaerales bacterium]
MLVTQKRPRVLRWYHAGPLLFGDWGTSRLYVLGLAFYFTGHSSPQYLAVMALLMVAVAWAYTIVCRCFPEGGGVYTAARHISPTLSVIGATLLLCGYIITAALSAVEGFHYAFNHLPGTLIVVLSIVTIFFVGVINWLGAKSAGQASLIIAIVAIVASAATAILCIPMLGEGFANSARGSGTTMSWWNRWESLVRIIIALSGVEAVANMTGLMTHPVKRTAKRTIWPVLIEVVVLNMVFGIAMLALPQLENRIEPDYQKYEVREQLRSDQVPSSQTDPANPVKDYRDTALKVLAIHAGTESLGEKIGPVFGRVVSVIFGLLLLSAINTAVMAMVSVMYSMAQDRELPRPLTRLNYSGVPGWGLIVACVLPAGVLCIMSDTKTLGELYAIGVVGAIAINVLSCAATKALDIQRWERIGLWTLGGLMGLIELTIVFAKPKATLFAGSMIVSVLVVRYFIRRRQVMQTSTLPEPATGWLAEFEGGPICIDPTKPRIMLAARGRYQAEYAVDMAKRRGATLFAMYVRTLRLMDMTPGSVPQLQDDRQALESLGTVAVLARQAGVPLIPIYVCSPEIAEEILDYTVTYGCDTLIMGKTKRSPFARRLEGDVVTSVAQLLPSEVALITRESTPYDPSHTVVPGMGAQGRPEKGTSETGSSARDEEEAPPT